MISVTTPDFWEAFKLLSETDQIAARKAYALFQANPSHPGLKFKQIHGSRALFSARVTRNCRALGRLEGDTVIWFWIGSHDEYDRLLKLG